MTGIGNTLTGGTGIEGALSGGSGVEAISAEPIALVGSVTSTFWIHGTNGGTLNVPTGTAIGDTMLIIQCVNGGFTTLNGATSFTKQTPPSQSTTGNQPQFYVWKRVFDSSPPASFFLQGNGTAYSSIFFGITLRNLDLTTLLAGTTQCTANNLITAGPFSNSAITPTDPGAFLVAVGMGHASNSVSLNAANGFTQRASATANAGSDIRGICLTLEQAGTSPVTCPAFTQGENNYARACTFALKPTE